MEMLENSTFLLAIGGVGYLKYQRFMEGGLENVAIGQEGS